MAVQRSAPNGMTLRALSAGAFAGMALSVATAGEMRIQFPQPYTLFQRDATGQGAVHIRGSFPADERPERVEARFGGRAWQMVDSKPGPDRFDGTIPAAVGQGLLEVRGAGGSHLAASVPCVGVGDLFLITGQSNADGRGVEMVALDPTNPYVGVKYSGNEWSEGCDPSSSDGKHSSPWPAVLNRLIPDQKVPIGFITAAVGSTVVKQWRKVQGASADKAWDPGGMHARAMKMVGDATGGSMKIRAVLYYQGENDLTHWNGLSVEGNYEEYKAGLMAAISDFWNELHVPVLVGQITYETDRLKCDNIRRAQQEVWTDNPHARQGPVTYDISGESGWTGHFTTAAEMQAYSGRWSAAILSAIYGRKECASPKLVRVVKSAERQLTFTYDQAMTLKAWNGRAGMNVEGFAFREGMEAVQDMRVTATEIRDKEVVVDVNRPVSLTLLIDYGNGADGQGRVILRSAATGLPAPMLFGRSLD